MTQPGDRTDPPSTDPASEPIDADIVELPPTGPAAPSYEEVTGYTQAGIPTFDHIRDKIERRTTTALGAEELAHGTATGSDAERAFADREKAAKAKLEEIRRSMGS